MSPRGRASPLHPPRPTGSLLLALCLLVAAASGCARPGLVDRAAATAMTGEALEVAVDEGWSSVAAGEAIPPGARLRTAAAEARLELRGGEVWLGPNAAARIDIDRVDVIRGETLVASGGALGTRWADVEITGEGVYRLSPGFSPRVGVYSGTVTVRRPGEERTVGRLRQIGLGTHRLPADGQPLAYRGDDPWDQELLPLAIAFDAEVEQLRRGLDRQYGTQPQPLDFYRTFTPFPAETVRLLVTSANKTGPGAVFGPPSDALIMLFVAQAGAEATDQTPQEAAEQVVARRETGAFWGLIATEFGITTADLARVVDVAQARRMTTAGGRPEPTAPALPSAPGASPVPGAGPVHGPPGSPQPRPPPGDPTPRGSPTAPAPPPPRTSGDPDAAPGDRPATSRPPPGEPARAPDAPEHRGLVEETLDLLLDPAETPGSR